MFNNLSTAPSKMMDNINVSTTFKQNESFLDNVDMSICKFMNTCNNTCEVSLQSKEGEYFYRSNDTTCSCDNLNDTCGSVLVTKCEIGCSHVIKQNDYEGEEMDYIVDVVIMPLLAIVGIIGNICALIYFGKKIRTKTRNLTYYSLMFSLTVSDVVIIVASILCYTFPYWFNPYALLECPICNYVIFGSYPIHHTAQLINIYLTISLSIERYFTICRPLAHHAREVPAVYYIVPIISFSTLYTLPVFFELQVVPGQFEKVQNTNSTLQFVSNATVYFIRDETWKQNLIYHNVYVTGTKLVFKFLVPCILLTTLNIVIVRALRNLTYTLTREQNYTLKLRDDDKQLPKDNEETEETDNLRVHIDANGRQLRQSQVDLGTINLAIAIVFLICYSLIGIWTVYDVLNLCFEPECLKKGGLQKVRILLSQAVLTKFVSDYIVLLFYCYQKTVTNFVYCRMIHIGLLR